MDIDQFRAQVQWVRDHFEVVTLEALVSRVREGARLRGLVCLTFDDAYVGFFASALPVLRSLGIPSTVFVVSEGAERGEPYWWDHPTLLERASPQRRELWLTSARGSGSTIFALEAVSAPGTLPPDLLPASWETIRSCMGPDLTVGAHTCNHPSLPTLSSTDLGSELEDCARHVAGRLGVRPRFLAYPYGAWDSRVREAARQAGYDAAFTLDAARIRKPETDLLALPRVNVPAGITAAAFQAWASGLLPPARSGQ